MTELGSISKMIEEKKKEQKQQTVYKTNIEEENFLFVEHLVRKGVEEKNMDAKKQQIKDDIAKAEK